MQQIATKKLALQLRQRAQKLGFNQFGICSNKSVPFNSSRLKHALISGWHAQMNWLEERSDQRANPNILWQEVKSIIIVGLNYAPKDNPLELLKHKNIGNISAYAKNKDYHDIIKGRLKELAAIFAKIEGTKIKVFVDTAPVMEKPLAQAAGIGWQGKHSVIVSREFGCWLFLGVIFTNIDLPLSEPETEKCGSCTKCLDICPTNAFPQAFKLDASKCLAYYNNEHKGHIPLEYRTPMGNRVFGCDDCLAICPWNKFAKTTSEIKFIAKEELASPKLFDLLILNDESFRKKFSKSPIKRLGHARFIRNVLICAGNSEDKTLLEPIKMRLKDKQPLIRAMAIWALSQLASNSDFLAQKLVLLPIENDRQVAQEWEII